MLYTFSELKRISYYNEFSLRDKWDGFKTKTNNFIRGKVLPITMAAAIGAGSMAIPAVSAMNNAEDINAMHAVTQEVNGNYFRPMTSAERSDYKAMVKAGRKQGRDFTRDLENIENSHRKGVIKAAATGVLRPNKFDNSYETVRNAYTDARKGLLDEYRSFNPNNNN